MPADTSPAQLLPPDVAAELRDLSERVAVLESRLPSPTEMVAAQRAIDELNASMQYIVQQLRETGSHAGIVDAGAPPPGDRPAHHVAPSVAVPPGNEGALFVGQVVVVNLSIGGLFVAEVVGWVDGGALVEVDGGVRGGRLTVRRDQVCLAPAAWRARP